MPEPLSTTHTLEQLRADFAYFNDLDFIRHFGARCTILDLHHVQTLIDPLQDLHRGGIQSAAVNGGILAAMFDLGLGMTGLYRSHPKGRSATVQLSMSFMRAVNGNVLDIRSWIERATSGLVFAAAEALDAEGKVCATATGMVRLMGGYSSKRAFGDADQASSK